MTYHIFIGYDERENEPFQVAKHSILKHATVPVKIHKLHHRTLRTLGLFTRPWQVNPDGTYKCLVDGRPFSTQFSHSRFLVPELWRNLNDSGKSPLCLFMDCDMVMTTDIAPLFKDLEAVRMRSQSRSPVHCVQHNYKPENTVKMDGCQQFDYNMKLWSSFMVFDMDHPDNAELTPNVVNTETGRWLHSFGWVTNKHSIGKIDESFNYIPNHSEKNTDVIRNIHYTEGGPWFENYRNCKYSKLWWENYNSFLRSHMLLTTVKFDVEAILHDT